MERSQEDHLDTVSENMKSTLGHANEAQSTLGREALHAAAQLAKFQLGLAVLGWQGLSHVVPGRMTKAIQFHTAVVLQQITFGPLIGGLIFIFFLASKEFSALHLSCTSLPRGKVNTTR